MRAIAQRAGSLSRSALRIRERPDKRVLSPREGNAPRPGRADSPTLGEVGKEAGEVAPGPSPALGLAPRDEARQSGMTRRRSLVEVGLALITAGVVVLLFVAYELVGTNLTEEHNQARLARQFKQEMAASAPVADAYGHTGATPRGEVKRAGAKRAALGDEKRSARSLRSPTALVALPAPPPGGALDHLVIPAIGVDRYVVQGVDEADLQEGPGHYPSTALPGQSGNVGIAGHRTTFGAPFFRLNELKAGDLVYLTNIVGTTWVYTVADIWVVAPTDVAVLNRSRRAELTLTTCNPRFEATSRLVVRAFLAAHLDGATLVGLRHLPLTLSAAQGLLSPSRARAGHSRGALPLDRATGPGRIAEPAEGAGTASPGSGPRPLASGGATAAGSPTVSATAPAGHPLPAVASSALRAPTPGWTWGQLAAWGALALGLWAGARLFAARRRRYASALALLGGGVLCLLPLWFAFENAAVLLPANF